MDADEVAKAAQLNWTELVADHQEESAVWEIVGKMACVTHTPNGDGDEWEESNAAAMVEQVKRLQEEAETTLAEIIIHSSQDYLFKSNS